MAPTEVRLVGLHSWAGYNYHSAIIQNSEYKQHRGHDTDKHSSLPLSN